MVSIVSMDIVYMVLRATETPGVELLSFAVTARIRELQLQNSVAAK